MKLSLDELKVDSYAVQVSESELAEVKGGTGWACVNIGISAVNAIISGSASPNSTSGGSGGSTNSNGTNPANGNASSGGTGTTIILEPDSSRYPNNVSKISYKTDSIVIRR